MPVMEGYLVSPEGVCGLTHTVSGGPFVTGPYMITQAFVGQSLTLSAATIRAYASGIGLVDEAEYDEKLDQRDAKISDLEAVVEAFKEELKMLKPAAERYWILEGQKDGQNFEEQQAKDQARIKDLEKQLQQLNRGGRPKKEATPA